jgi:hypothetical protein
VELLAKPGLRGARAGAEPSDDDLV